MRNGELGNELREPAVPPKAPPHHQPSGSARRGVRATLSLYLKGLAVGVSDLVPGFSGGTMALILGIYSELMASIGAFSSARFLNAVRGFRVREALHAVNAPFLVTLMLGIISAVALLAPAASHALTIYPLQVSAFFFGLVLASVTVAGRLVRRWGSVEVALLLAGAAGAFLLLGLTPGRTPSGTLFLLLAGAVAVSALVLPGISGSFILLLLGKYDVALTAVRDGDFGVLLPLALGGILGVIAFARLLSHLLRRHHDAVMALLVGFVLGSLRKVWPFVTRTGNATLPWAAEGANPWGLVALILIGALAVALLERAGSRHA